MIHCLKTWPEPFQEVLEGRKRYELRKDDRGFVVGDLLCLQEWDPGTCEYTGRETQARISCITRSAGPLQLLDGLVVLGLEDPQGLGDVRRELARLVAFLHDLAMTLGVPASFGEVEEERLQARAVELRDQAAVFDARIAEIARKGDLLAHHLVTVRGRIQDAHATLMMGTAPQSREHLQQAAKELTAAIEGRL